MFRRLTFHASCLKTVEEGRAEVFIIILLVTRVGAKGDTGPRLYKYNTHIPVSIRILPHSFLSRAAGENPFLI